MPVCTLLDALYCPRHISFRYVGMLFRLTLEIDPLLADATLRAGLSVTPDTDAVDVDVGPCDSRPDGPVGFASSGDDCTDASADGDLFSGDVEAGKDGCDVDAGVGGSDGGRPRYGGCGRDGAPPGLSTCG
jgi:hypothetical protein